MDAILGRQSEATGYLGGYGVGYGRNPKTPGGSPVGGHFVRGLVARPEGIRTPDLLIRSQSL